MGRQLTLRGTFQMTAEPNQTFRKLLDYEGVDLTIGWKIIGGEGLLLSDPGSGFKGIVLHTDDTQKVMMSFEDNQTIGWIGNTVSAGEPRVGVIDPN
ncbi:unnamed protein product, partial [marine sediment metagenome]